MWEEGSSQIGFDRNEATNNRGSISLPAGLLRISPLPETSSSTDDPVDATNISQMGVAAHDMSSSKYGGSNSYLRSGVAISSEELLPLDDFSQLRLDAIEDPLQFQHGHLDLVPYLEDPVGFTPLEGSVVLTTNPHFSSESDELYPLNPSDNSSSSGYIPVESVSNRNDSVCAYGYQESSSSESRAGDLIDTETTDQCTLSGLLEQDFSTVGSQSDHLMTRGVPSDLSEASVSVHPHYRSQIHEESAKTLSQQEELLLSAHESQDPPVSVTGSRKRYKHRHRRAYSLPEEEQKQRNQVHEEASQLRRRREGRVVRDLEAEMDKEKERNKNLHQIYQRLQEEMSLYRTALNRYKKS